MWFGVSSEDAPMPVLLWPFLMVVVVMMGVMLMLLGVVVFVVFVLLVVAAPFLRMAPRSVVDILTITPGARTC